MIERGDNEHPYSTSPAMLAKPIVSDRGSRAGREFQTDANRNCDGRPFYGIQDTRDSLFFSTIGFLSAKFYRKKT
jgi:hypothetical protein